MMMEKIPLVVICGPTGSGKTSLALELAQHFPLEIISADSRQVFRHMNIGTAKATLEEQDQVTHHMIDLIEPDQEFSVAEFVDRAKPLIHAIMERQSLPCVVGGTGLYIKALVGGMADLPGSDEALRRQMHQREAEQGPGTLYRELQQLDPVSAQQIHPRNIIRIVRALEVFRLSGKTISELKDAHRFATQPYRVIQFAPRWDRTDLYARIEHRSVQMLDLGLVDEVRSLVEHYSFDLKALQTLGYREVIRYLKNIISAEQMLSEIQQYTRQYAKRQMTWFRKEAEIIWVDSLTESGKVVQSIDNFIRK
jgi:tRNA dimethylallyltransferase